MPTQESGHISGGLLHPAVPWKCIQLLANRATSRIQQKSAQNWRAWPPRRTPDGGVILWWRRLKMLWRGTGSAYCPGRKYQIKQHLKPPPAPLVRSCQLDVFYGDFIHTGTSVKRRLSERLCVDIQCLYSVFAPFEQVNVVVAYLVCVFPFFILPNLWRKRKGMERVWIKWNPILSEDSFSILNMKNLSTMRHNIDCRPHADVHLM